MTTRSILALAFAAALALGLGGCVLPASDPNPDFYIEVTDPGGGAVVPVGSTLYVDGFAHSSGTAITRMDFYASGVWLGSSSGADLIGSSFGVDGEAYWTPGEVGEYHLQASARRRGGFIFSAPVRVCVVDFGVDAGNTYQAAYGYEGTCPIPPRDSDAKPGPVTMAVAANPSSFAYISPAADGSVPFEVAGCSPSRTIHFRATVVDPPQDVAFVTILLSLTPGPGASDAWAGRGPATSTFILSQTGGFPESTRIFEGTTSVRPNPAFVFGDVGGSITWTANAIGRDGSILVTYGPHDIPAVPCLPAVPLSAPFTPTTAPTKIPAATATWTPSAANCPPGTYYSPNINQCIAIEIIPTKPSAEDCAAFGNKGSCRRSGCSWDDKAGICSK